MLNPGYLLNPGCLLRGRNRRQPSAFSPRKRV